MGKTKIGYMTKNGYVEDEVSFEEISLEEAEKNGVEEVNWQDNKQPFSANSFFETTAAFTVADTETKQFDIASIQSWPEFKTDWKMTCVKVFGKKVCTKTPQLFTRTCHRRVYAELAYPSDYTDQIKEDIADCAKVAAAAAVAAAIATGAVGAAPAFEVAFKSCAIAKLKDLMKDIRINVNSDANCGGWTPR